jgi:hypothetical protein
MEAVGRAVVVGAAVTGGLARDLAVRVRAASAVATAAAAVETGRVGGAAAEVGMKGRSGPASASSPS